MNLTRADDGVLLPLGTLAHTYQISGGNIVFDTVEFAGATYGQTALYTGGSMTFVSPWYRYAISSSVERINRNKILGLYNSNAATSALSQSAWKQYCAAYKIDASHMLGFDMGTTDGIPNFVSVMMPAIQDYVAKNGITAIFCSLGVPVAATATGVQDDTLRYLKLCGGPIGRLPASSQQNVLGTSSSTPSGSLLWTGAGNSSPSGSIPVGRLGIALSGNYANESISDMLRLANDSIAVANTNNRAKPFVQGFYSRPPAGVAAYTNQNHLSAWYTAQAGGLTNRSNYVNGTLDAPGLTTQQQSETTVQSAASILAGTANPLVSYFMLYDVAIVNTAVPATSFVPMPGAVAFNWTSNGFGFVNEQLKRGAACGIASVSEPEAGFLPQPAALIDRLLRGYSCCEAVLVCASNQGDAYGDPLNTPYAV